MLPAPDERRGAAAGGRRRLDRRRQVDAGQLAGRPPGHRARPAAAHDPVAGPGAPPRRRHWFGQDRLLPDLVRVEQPTDDRDSLQLVAVRHGAARPGDPGRARRRLGRGGQPAPRHASCSPPPTCGCSSPRRRATPTRSRGSTSSGPPSASTSVAIVLDRTPADAVRTVAAHLARMLASRGLKDSPLFTVGEAPVSEDGLLDRGRGRRRARLAGLARRGPRRPRRPWCGRRSTARSARWPAQAHGLADAARPAGRRRGGAARGRHDDVRRGGAASP